MNMWLNTLSSTGRLILCGVVCVVSWSMLGGCSKRLETGYEPRKLNASAEKRRAFYAAPFTEASRAGVDEDDLNDDPRYRRPGY